MKWNRPIRFQGGVRFLELSVGDGVGLLELNVSDGVIAKQTNFSDKDGGSQYRVSLVCLL